MAVPDSRLGAALQTALGQLLPGVFLERGDLMECEHDVVVTVPGACSPADCRKLATNGARVIILSPMALLSERRLYEAAGAFAYLPMQIDATTLIANTIELALIHLQGFEPATDSRTAVSHEPSPRAC